MQGGRPVTAASESVAYFVQSGQRQGSALGGLAQEAHEISYRPVAGPRCAAPASCTVPVTSLTPAGEHFGPVAFSWTVRPSDDTVPVALFQQQCGADVFAVTVPSVPTAICTSPSFENVQWPLNCMGAIGAGTGVGGVGGVGVGECGGWSGLSGGPALGSGATKRVFRV